MNLLVDIGNTCIKWAVENNTVLGPQKAFLYRQTKLPEQLNEHWKSIPLPGQVLVSNVAGKDIREVLTAWVKDRWNVETRIAEVEQFACGVTNAYHDVRQLGVDRWLAIIAAWNRFKSPVCVVDCGTAITIDGVAVDGIHLGGPIIPGLLMMQEALVRNTRGIDVKTGTDITPEFGKDTQKGVANGCCLAAVALIDRGVQNMHAETGSGLNCVITGGAARFVLPYLAADFISDPQLVLRGLSSLFRDKP